MASNETHVGNLPHMRGQLEPKDGWKERTYYVVEVAKHRHNPIHRAILYVGFFPGSPRANPLSGGYTTLFNASYDGLEYPSMMYYLRAVCEIKEMSDGR